MKTRLLLDTHIVVRWLTTPGKLSREQLRILRDADRKQEPFGISAITLLELAVLGAGSPGRLAAPVEKLLAAIEATPTVEVIPLTVPIAAEVAAIGASLRDPADRVIVATARVHALRLVTSDQLIIESRLVPVVD